MDTSQPSKRPKRQPRPAGQRAPSEPLFTASELLRSYIESGGYILPSSSVAYTENAAFAQQMRLDAGIEGALRNLRVTLAQLPWTVAPLPQFEGDPVAEGLSRRITECISRIPRFTDLLYTLHGAKWYGLGVVNVIYGQSTEITDWVGLDPDSMAFDRVGNIGVKVGAKYLQDGGGVAGVTTGFDGFVRILDAMERDSVIVHRVFSEAPNFLISNSADLMYRGRGARDVCWYYWQMKQGTLRAMVAYENAYAQGGIRKGWYPDGDDAAQRVMLGILTKLDRIGSVALPFDPRKSAAEQPWGMELLTMPQGTGEIYLKALEYFDSKCKEAIVGQNLSSEAAGTGLGSGVAKMHGDTFANELRYNANAVSESLTVDLVRVLAHRMGATPEEARRIAFSQTVQQQDVKDYMEGVERFVRLGGSVPVEAVREKLGLPEPNATDPVLRQETGGLFDEPADQPAI